MISRVVRDVRDTSAPLVSDVLDLGQVKNGLGVWHVSGPGRGSSPCMGLTNTT